MILTLIVLSTLVRLAFGAAAHWPEAEDKSINYTSVPGYFLQDDPATDPGSFDYASETMLLVLTRLTPGPG